MKLFNLYFLSADPGLLYGHFTRLTGRAAQPQERHPLLWSHTVRHGAVHWVIFRADAQAFAALPFNKLAGQISEALGCGAFSLSNFEGDYLEMHLFSKGVRIDGLSVIEGEVERWLQTPLLFAPMAVTPALLESVTPAVHLRPEAAILTILHALGLQESWREAADPGPVTPEAWF